MRYITDKQVWFIEDLMEKRNYEDTSVLKAIASGFNDNISSEQASEAIDYLLKCEYAKKDPINDRIIGWTKKSIIAKAKLNNEFSIKLRKLARYTNQHLNIVDGIDSKQILDLAIEYKVKKVVDAVAKYAN